MSDARGASLGKAVRLLQAAALTAAVGGCVAPSLRGVSVPPPVAQAARAEAPHKDSPERAAAVEEMRAEAEAAGQRPFPDVFQTERNTRLAARDEPISTEDVQAVTAELSEIARRRATATSAAEIAALDARAKELQRLAAAAAAGTVRK